MLTVYIGATFQIAGGLQKDGAPADFTNWALTSNLYDAAGTTKIAQLAVTWLNQSIGAFMLTAPSTASWPALKARIDCKLVSPMGDIILGPPVFMRIAQSPLS